MTTSERVHSSKLSIYDASSPALLMPNESSIPSALESSIGHARQLTVSTVANLHSKAQELTSSWIGSERRIESRLKSLAGENETLTPGALYLGVAALAGSVLARNRHFPLRLATPPLFFGIAAFQLYPQTTANVRAYVWSLEQRYSPAFASLHASVHSATHDYYVRASQLWSSLSASAEQKMQSGLQQLQQRQDSGTRALQSGHGKQEPSV